MPLIAKVVLLQMLATCLALQSCCSPRGDWSPRVATVSPDSEEALQFAIEGWIRERQEVPDVVIAVAPSGGDGLAHVYRFDASSSGRYVWVESQGGRHIYFDHPMEIGRLSPLGARSIGAFASSRRLPFAVGESQGSYLVVPGRLFGVWLDELRKSDMLDHIGM